MERSAIKRSEALPLFLEWMIGQGVEMGTVELTELPLYGCCVRATKQINSGELLFSIPEKLMMSTQTAKTSSIGGVAIKKVSRQHNI